MWNMVMNTKFKTNIIKFIINNSTQYTRILHIRHNDKYIEETVSTTFLGLKIDNHLNWKNHTDQLVLSGACYAARSYVTYQQWHSKINVFCLLSLYNDVKIVFWGKSSNRSQDSTVSIATRYVLDDRGVRVWVPVWSRIFSSLHCLDWLWGPRSLLSNGYKGFFPRG
jgi:hypothetical protein